MGCSTLEPSVASRWELPPRWRKPWWTSRRSTRRTQPTRPRRSCWRWSRGPGPSWILSKFKFSLLIDVILESLLFYLIDHHTRVYKVADTLIFFPTRQGTLIFSPNPNLALNIGKSYIFIAYLGSLKLILRDSIKKQEKTPPKRIWPNLFPLIFNLIWPLGP